MNDNFKKIEFLSFCIEMYANRSAISGVVVARQFDEFGILDFLLENYETLHTQGWQYTLPIINDIIKYRQNKKTK
ncbi:MAG: DUF3791 domain-containing protein [Planctomycetaceae bacterium]|jgi:hypothetical protein|nr:DUF3791 domain-containing protein [Planctomycetaceae bacterium]